MSEFDRIELTMLTAALSSAICYRGQEPEELVKISKTLNDWSHADEQGRRNIYRAWRNQ